MSIKIKRLLSILLSICSTLSVYADTYHGHSELGNIAIFYYWFCIIAGLICYFVISALPDDEKADHVKDVFTSGAVHRFARLMVDSASVFMLVACGWMATAALYLVTLMLIHSLKMHALMNGWRS